MNEIQLQEAANNMQNLINTGLKAGLFSEFKSVLVMQASLEKLIELARTSESSMNHKQAAKPPKDHVLMEQG